MNMKKLTKIPETLTYNGSEFEAHVTKTIGDKELINHLRKKADEFLTKKSPAVTDRRIKAESGDAHDYSSLGPYWWPNPDTENGLPYIRRDGEVNPDTKDNITFASLFSSVETLTLAAYCFDDDRYAEKAVKNISVWYLDRETKMNPHLKYGQAIPGICSGRGIGLIDCSHSYKLFDSVALLDAMGAIPADILSGLREWYGSFLDWMLTSETGVDEDRQHNNHGSWYDVQVASTALFLGRKILAERQLSLAYERRLLKHIAPDGKQPHELARTNALGYSIMNLNALMLIADLAEKAGCKIDMWTERRADGSIALRAALDYLTRFTKSLDGFGYSQLNGKPNPDATALLITMAARHYPEADYQKKAEELYKPDMLWRLLPL